MKYLKLYETFFKIESVSGVSQNPDRISSEMFKIYSNKLEMSENSYNDKKDLNLFYMSDIQVVDSSGLLELDDDDPIGWRICLSFYNPNIDIFGSKLINVYFMISREYDLTGLWGEVGKTNTIIDISFSKDSFREIVRFLEEDSPKIAYTLDCIFYSDIVNIHKQLLRRI